MADLPNDSPAILDAANHAFDTTLKGLGDKGVSDFVAYPVAGLVWTGMFTLSILKQALSFALKDVALPVALQIVKVITDVRESGGAEFASIAAAVMGEFLGVEIDPGNLSTGQGAAAAAQRSQAIGAAFLDMLVGNLQGTGPIQPADGAANAKKLAGYAINFAATNRLMSIIAELVSDEHLTQLGDLGEDISRNLGLPRLIRTVIQPVVNAAVALPYKRFAFDVYRPTELTVGELLLGLHSGRLAENDVTNALQQLGYSDQWIAELKLQHLPRLTLTEVDSLLRWGKVDQSGAVKVLTDQGWPAELAQQRLDALHLAGADREERAYGAEIVKLAQERMIDQDTFASLLARLHLSDEEKQGLANRVGVFLETHHKALTIGELLYLTERNLITGDQVLAWAEQQGYDATGQQDIDLFVTEKVLEYQAAQAAKAAKAAAAAAKKKGSAPPPKP